MSKAEFLEEFAHTPLAESVTKAAGKLFDELRGSRALSNVELSKDAPTSKSLRSLVFSPAEEASIRNGTSIPVFTAIRREGMFDSNPLNNYTPKIDLVPADQLDLPSGFNYSRLRDAIVRVHTRYEGGTGFVTEDGLIATNLHVIQHQSDGLVKLLHADGSTTKGKLVAVSLTDDLALIKSDQKLSSTAAIELGSSSQLVPDDMLHAIGHPGNVQYQTVASGPFSKIADQPSETVRDGRAKFGVEQVLLNSGIRNWPGYSGGPIFKDREAVGIISGRSPLGSHGPTAEHLSTLSEIVRKDGVPDNGFLKVITTSATIGRNGHRLHIDVLHTRAADLSEFTR